MTEVSVFAEEQLEIEGDEQDKASPLPLGERKRVIRTQAADPEITSLYEKYKRGKLILQPDFQRQFVWDRTKASRLIESVLLSVPLPVFYLAQEGDGRELVIDGQQRLMSFFSFIDGRMPGGEPFHLQGLTVFPELNGKSYQELDRRLQDTILYYPLRTITIQEDSDPDIKFEIFKRLNTGAVPLNNMEMRNCIYHGPYMKLLKELADDPEFKSLVGFKEPDKRMRDLELVLRFAVFYHFTYLKYQSPMKTFLNRDMEAYRHIKKKDADELQRAFRNSLQIVGSLFGDRAFRRFIPGTEANPNGIWETKRFNASLYDVLMGVFADREKNQVYAALDSIREGLIDLMANNREFIDSILLGTSQVIRVRKRFDLTRQVVDGILANHQPQPRCFSLALKRALYDADPTCALCDQRIQHLDDAAVDHIQQYWQGGKTIPENARLTHRYCNNSRPRRE